LKQSSRRDQRRTSFYAPIALSSKEKKRMGDIIVRFSATQNDFRVGVEVDMDGGKNFSLVQMHTMVEAEHNHLPPGTLVKRNTLTSSGLWHSVLVVCTLMSTAGTYIIIARELGPRTFGIYLLIQWLTTISIPLLGTGMSALNSRSVALVQSKEPPRLMAGVFYFLWYRQHLSIVFYCLFSAVVAFVLTKFLHIFALDLLILAGLATLPVMLSGVAGTTLRSLHRNSILTVLHLLGAVTTLLLVLIATRLSGRPIEAFLLAFAMANTFTLILAVICIIRLLPLEQAQKPGIFLRERLRDGLHHSWFLFVLDVIIWQHGELLFLAWHITPSEIGFYALGSLVSAKMIDVAPVLFSSWLFPWRARTTQYRFLNPYDAFIRTSYSVAFLAAPLCAITILATPLLVTFFLGTAYLPLVRPMQVLLMATAFGSVAAVGLTYLSHYAPIGKTATAQLQVRCTIGIALFKIVIAVPLILIGGMLGAALASTLAQIISSLLTLFTCRKMLIHYDAVSK
jgi:O-antigen/teichoic acid export membrane protein